jgi:Ser/Thr protein kinase RdoA (MazF antagonist)
MSVPITPAVLDAWNLSDKILPASDAGLINQTFVVGTPAHGILQWVNPIFHPDIHEDINAMTNHLSRKGILTTHIIPTRHGELTFPAEKGCWRMLEFIPGRTLHVIDHPNIAFEAGQKVAQFHAALSDYSHPRIGPMRDIHNTPVRMAELRNALSKIEGHHLKEQILPLAESILKNWEEWEGDLDLPLHMCHGDLKISNLHFHPTEDKAICLLDLDTIGPQTIAAELGDAWRSWCNPKGESSAENIYFDLPCFEASAKGYFSSSPQLTQKEVDNLVPGIMRICIELASRFCTDAILNTYFSENTERYPIKGMHNFIRAQSQFALYKSVKEQRLIVNSILKNQRSR